MATRLSSFKRFCSNKFGAIVAEVLGNEKSTFDKELVEILAYQIFHSYGSKLPPETEVKNALVQALVSLGNNFEIYFVLRGFLLEQLEIELEVPANMDLSHYSVAQINFLSGVKSVFWQSVSVTSQKLIVAKNFTMDKIWEMAKLAFKTCLGSYYDVVIKTAGWINDMWNRMQIWCNEMIEKSANWMAGFKDCLSFGVGLIGVSAVIMLIENFMLGSGILTSSIGLAQMFVLCYVGYLGLREGGSSFSADVVGKINRLVSACKSVVANLATTISADNAEVSNAQSDPLSLLEAFAKSLSAFSMESVVKMGRTFNAVTQIKTGITTVWTCVEKIAEFLWDLLDKGFGIKSKALADLSVMLGMDVQGWLRRCDAACEHLCLFPSIPQETLTSLKVLKQQGFSIRAALLGRTERGSMAALTCVNKALEKLSQLLTSAILAGTAGPRFEPFWVAFTGKPGVGKSTCVNALVAQHLNDRGLDQSDMYARNTQDQFWSGYRRQEVVTYDDLGAISNGTTISEEAELIKLVSRDALPLNMASIEEKGMYFDSSLIVTSSNFIGFSPHAQIHDSQAYYRRRSMLIEVLHKEGTEKNPADPLVHQRYSIKSNIEPFNEIGSFETFKDLYAHFVDLNTDHGEKQVHIMKALKTNIASQDRKVASLASLLPMLLGVVPTTIEDFVKKHHQGWSFLIYSKGRMHLVNEKLEHKVVTDFDGIHVEDLQRAEKDALTAALRYSDVLRNMPKLDPLAAHFLVDLVTKNVYTDKLEIRKGLQTEDDQLSDVAKGLQMWQRAMVYELSNALSENNKGVFSTMYDGMCSALQKAYATDVANWPVAVKLCLGITAFLVFGKSIFWVLQKLGSFGGGAGLAVAATQAFSLGQSDDDKKENNSEYRHRNSPIKTRHWSRAQNDGISYEWLMRHCLVSMRWANYECQALILPGKRLVTVAHYMLRIPDNVIVEIIMDDQKYHICWHASCVEQLQDSELACYKHATLRDAPSTILNRIVFGLEHLPDVFPAVMCSCKRNEFSGDYDSEVAHLMVKKRNIALNIFSGEYSRLVPQCLEYKAPTVNKDCGSLIVARIDGVDKLVGLHVAGISGYGQACFLPNSLEMSEGQNWFEEDFKPFSYPESVGDGVSVVGLIKPEKKFFVQQKTSLTKTPESWHLGTESAKEPAILSKFDERLIGTQHAGYDPYRKGMEKYKDPAGPFEVEILDGAAEQIVQEWNDAAQGRSFEECSVSQAINGIIGVEYYDPLVMNTSEGYPYILDRHGQKGKSRYFVEKDGNLVPNEELQVKIDDLLEESSRKVPVLVGVECAKDEKLPLEKIYERPKTRLFTVLPMDFNIVIRMKFFAFVKFIMEARNMLPCQVGVNPYGREWARIANSLLEKGNNILCCDYSRFDGIMPKQIMFTIACMINTLMGGSEFLKRQRTNLLMACCGRYAICSGIIWRVENGIPSGFPMTVIINSIFNELIVRYIYCHIFATDKLVRSSFQKYVSMVTYGDDNLISINSTIVSKFNGPSVQKLAVEHHIGITDGVNKNQDLSFRELATCDFLKRKFVKDNQGRWRAPMELDSLWSQLHWVKTKFLGLTEAYLVNLETVLRELYIHDVGMAKTFRARALSVDWIEPSMIPTMEQIHAFHEMQYSGMNISAYGYDALLVPSMLGPIGQVEVESHDFEIRRLVATVSGKYKFVPNDFVVCLRVRSKYGLDGMFVEWPATSGRGELPTAQWIRQHFLRSTGEIFKTLKKRYGEGKRIVFLARNDNVFSTVFLTLFGLQMKIFSVKETNQILSKAISMVGSLGYLVDAFPEAFFANDDSKSLDKSVGRIYRVYNAGASELNYMRLGTSNVCFEGSSLSVPNFGKDFHKYAEYILEKEGPGILMLTELKVLSLAGYPGLDWPAWVSKGGGIFEDGQMVAHAIYFDNAHLLHAEYATECSFKVGKRIGDVVCVWGRPLNSYGMEERIKFQPVVQATKLLFEKLKEE